MSKVILLGISNLKGGPMKEMKSVNAIKGQGLLNDRKLKENNHKKSQLTLIEIEKWVEAKKQISNLLEHKPSKEICLLMSKIEEGDTNDPQKVNAWISRSNFGDLNRIWICSITNISQLNWSSVSDSGHFNTLEWKKPRLIGDFQAPNVETNIIKYINN